MAGYVVECALKACIAKLTKRHDFPAQNAKDVYTHKITPLLQMAGLEKARDAELNRDSEFKANWYAVKEWSEQSRYDAPGREDAEGLFNAVADRRHGVLRWIRQYW